MFSTIFERHLVDNGEFDSFGVQSKMANLPLRSREEWCRKGELSITEVFVLLGFPRVDVNNFALPTSLQFIRLPAPLLCEREIRIVDTKFDKLYDRLRSAHHQ